MYPARKPQARRLFSLSYWSPSAGNFLSLIVLSLGLDMRIRADAIKVLQIISNGSTEDLMRIVERSGPTEYRTLRTEVFSDMRLRAIALVTKSLSVEGMEC